MPRLETEFAAICGHFAVSGRKTASESHAGVSI
jgi:hypothetical protein